MEKRNQNKLPKIANVCNIMYVIIIGQYKIGMKIYRKKLLSHEKNDAKNRQENHDFVLCDRSRARIYVYST